MAVKRNRFIDDASASALVRYGPELSALKELMATAQQGYRQRVHAATASAAMTRAAVHDAIPEINAIYAAAPSGGFPGLGRAAALQSAVDRGVQASAAVGGQRQVALTQLRADQAKIAGRRTDIAGEIGAFTSSEAGRLGRESAQRDLQNRISLRSTGQSERNSLRSAGLDPDTGAPIPGGKLDPKATKGKVQTQAAHAKLAASISDARDVALRLAKTAVKRKGSQTRNFVDSVLRNGVDEPATRTPVYETVKTATGTKRQPKLNKDNTPVYKVVPAVKIPQISAAERGAALDLIFDGHVSAKHVRQLHAAGFSIDQLGLPTRRNPQAPQVKLPKPRVARPYTRPGPRVA